MVVRSPCVVFCVPYVVVACSPRVVFCVPYGGCTPYSSGSFPSCGRSPSIRWFRSPLGGSPLGRSPKSPFAAEPTAVEYTEPTAEPTGETTA